MVQDLAFCGVVFLCNGVSHSTCAYKQGVPVVGAEKEVKSAQIKKKKKKKK